MISLYTTKKPLSLTISLLLSAVGVSTEVFADNLSIGAGSDGSSKASRTSYSYVRDGNMSTYWSPTGSTGRISIKWSSATTIDSVVIKEAVGFEGNIGSWILTNHKTGDLLASGSGAGTISFNPVSLKKISFNITSSTAKPAVAEFETYAGSTQPTPTPTPTPAPAPTPIPTPIPTPAPTPDPVSTDNLSIGAGSDGSSKASGTSYRYVRDGNMSSYWSPNGPTGRISIKWSSATHIGSVSIKEAAGFEGNIGSWNLTNHATGDVLASGSGAGKIYFDPVSLTKVNFNITNSTGMPAVAEFETYAGSDQPSPTPTPTPSSTPTPLPTPEPTPDPTIDPNATTVSSAEELLSAIASAQAGSTIYIRGGTYYFGETIILDQNGSSSNVITLSKRPDDSERPLLDFSAMSENGSNRGLKLQGDYWHIYGIDVKKAGDNCLFITGSYNQVEFSTFSECADTGVQLAKGASQNLIKNVDSYYNADSSLENADGFAAKLDVGDGNRFYGCRAWNNLDDGFDAYLRGANNVTTTYENSWVIRNGYLKDGTLGAGDGNGFKTGGSDGKNLKHNAVFINTIAAGNAVDGYDHNSNRGEVTIYNAIAHDNGRNINFSSTNRASKLTVKNTISIGARDSLKASSTDIEANSWQDGRSVTESDFVSVDIDELLKPRKADGSLPDVNYFKPIDGSDLIDAGIDVGLPYNGSAPDIGVFESD